LPFGPASALEQNVIGEVVLSPATHQFRGYPILVQQALIRMTMFLGALTFMYVSARAVGDGEYRYQFLDPLIDDLKLTLWRVTATSVTSIDLRTLRSQRGFISGPFGCRCKLVVRCRFR
jgi:hypothetical protein